ncbi:MAG: flagella assembly protein FlgT middle domain-containing protein [Succinivibrio sp.]
MRFTKTLKNTVMVMSLMAAFQSQAGWYTASGTGSDRNDAVNDALKTILLQSGADIQIEQTFNNGVMRNDSISIRSHAPVKKVIVTEEQRTLDKFTVTIKAFINEKQINKCSEASVKKGFQMLVFKYADSDVFQGSIGVEGIEKEMTRIVFDRLKNSSVFAVRSPVNANLANSTETNANEDFKEKNLAKLGENSGSQYVMRASISSVSVSDVGNNMLTKLIFSRTRSINFDIEVYDAVNKIFVFRRSYTGEADWPYKQGERVDLKGDNFKNTSYGMRLYELCSKAADDLTAELRCAPVSSRVIDIDGDNLIISMGRDNGLEVGKVFSLEQSSTINTAQGVEYDSIEKTSGHYKVIAVYPHAAKLHPTDLQNNILNIDINDIVTLR